MRAVIIAALVAGSMLLAACGESEPAPTPTPTLAATVTLTATPTATPTPAASPTDTPVPQTQVILWLDLGPEVVEETQGSCWTGSGAVERPDAWRCSTVDDVIYDPCFSRSSADTSVLCPKEPPWDMTAVRIDLSEPLPLSMGHEGEDIARVFALETFDGTRCVFITGATGVVYGERANYACGDDWWVIGSPQVSTSMPWTVKMVRMAESPEEEPLEYIAEAPVRTVWR